MKLCTDAKELVSFVVDTLLCQSVTSLAFGSMLSIFIFFSFLLLSPLGYFFPSVFFPFLFDCFFLLPSPFLLSSFSYFRRQCYGSLLFSCQHFNHHQRSHQLKPDSVLTQNPHPNSLMLLWRAQTHFPSGKKWEREEGVSAGSSRLKWSFCYTATAPSSWPLSASCSSFLSHFAVHCTEFPSLSELNSLLPKETGTALEFIFSPLAFCFYCTFHAIASSLSGALCQMRDSHFSEKWRFPSVMKKSWAHYSVEGEPNKSWDEKELLDDRNKT